MLKVEYCYDFYFSFELENTHRPATQGNDSTFACKVLTRYPVGTGTCSLRYRIKTQFKQCFNKNHLRVDVIFETNQIIGKTGQRSRNVPVSFVNCIFLVCIELLIVSTGTGKF